VRWSANFFALFFWSVGLVQSEFYTHPNSRRLVTVHLKQLAEVLGLPTKGAADEIRQMIEENLQETHEVRNVQVVIAEANFGETKLSLMDDSGVLETEVVPGKGGLDDDGIFKELED